MVGESMNLLKITTYAIPEEIDRLLEWCQDKYLVKMRTFDRHSWYMGYIDIKQLGDILFPSSEIKT